MATNNKITTTELDFNNIKSNFKTFLQGQSEFSDYNFEGSSLSILLDVLAYNTHYNSLYTNLAVNESFLDSASKRESAVSRAFELGYLPRSAKAASSLINITVSNVSGNPSTLVLPAYTPFTTIVDGSPYTFYNIDPYTVVNTTNLYKFTNVKITEGTPLVQSYVVSDGSKYVISNLNVDIDTLSVGIKSSSTASDITNYTRVDDILSVTGTDLVYFIKEVDGGYYEIQFGNDRIGKALSNGNVIVLSYMVTNKAAANGAKVFNSANIGTSSIVTVSTSSGGDESETIDDIKFNAPRLFSAVNRAVTSDDYKVLINSQFTNIESINVWGGEENVPPVYGKVFISVSPKTGNVLTSAEKTNILENILKSKKIVTITPEFIEPSYLDLNIATSVYYNPNNTVNTSNDIILKVTAAILEYNNTYLKKFDSIFRYSKFMSIIDGVDDSITSNITLITAHLNVEVKFNVSTSYTISINNPIYTAGVPENVVVTNGFYVTGDTNIQYLKDDGYGVLQRYYIDSNNNIVYTNINNGSVDYATGIIYVNTLNITKLVESTLDMKLKLQSNDIISIGNKIVRIDPTLLKVNTISEATSNKSNYIFSPSR